MRIRRNHGDHLSAMALSFGFTRGLQVLMSINVLYTTTIGDDIIFLSNTRSLRVF
jgi:hypothetical protein